MIIVDIEQRSEAWFKEKIGKPSASKFNKIYTMSGISKQRKAYLYEMVAEKLMGEKIMSYSNANMEMGNEREDESRKMYELLFDVEVNQVGCVYANEEKKYLCSPDGIINNEYGLEIKNVLPSTQVKRLLENKLPSEYFSQIQGSLLLTGFDRWDFFSYCPGLEPLHIIVERDEDYIVKLDNELFKFCKELDSIVSKLKGDKS